MQGPADKRGHRLLDANGRMPRRGAQTEFANRYGIDRQAVIRAIRKGRLLVDQYGELQEAENYKPQRPVPLTSLADITAAVIRFIRNTATVDPAGAEAAAFSITDTARRTINAVTDRPTTTAEGEAQ